MVFLSSFAREVSELRARKKFSASQALGGGYAESVLA
jgi:hypothetical protein